MCHLKQKKAEMFSKYFSSVFVAEDVTQMPQKLDIPITQFLENVVFSQDDVLQLLMKVNICKSPGPDNIQPRVLKECASELSLPLFTLFKSSMESGMLPDQWKEAKVSPIFKKGARTDVRNYRPVSYLCVLQDNGEVGQKCSTESYDCQQFSVRLSTWFCAWSIMYDSVSSTG